MLKQLILENWKSFRHAVLDLDQLTILIGTNASGKSNAIDALEFLHRTARGSEIQAALAGDQMLSSLRGGVEWAAFKPERQFTLKVLVQGEDDRSDYLYSITVETLPRVQLVAESLDRIDSEKNEKLNLFETQIPQKESPSILAHFGLVSLTIAEKEVTVRLGQDFRRSHSILSQLDILSINSDIVEEDSVNSNILARIAVNLDRLAGVRAVSSVLQNIFVLDAIPSLMRAYSPLSDRLQSDASNIAGVLAALPDQQKKHIESTLADYATHLPERDICRVWAEKVGRFETDAMLYCEELWTPSQPPTVVDARGMSDGTLRFLAILTALLTRPEGSQMVIEEVDNGLHPSRSELLVKMLREVGEKRQVDILVTTHNPALLDAIGPEMVPFVVVAHRNFQSGESQLTLLEEIENLPKLMASGPLGKLAAKGAIEKSLSRIG